MKRILFLILVIILAGCEKKVDKPVEDKFCYTCIVRQEWKVEGRANDFKEQAVDFCGYTDGQISRMEKDSTYQEYEIYRLVWHSMKCSKK